MALVSRRKRRPARCREVRCDGPSGSRGALGVAQLPASTPGTVRNGKAPREPEEHAGGTWREEIARSAALIVPSCSGASRPSRRFAAVASLAGASSRVLTHPARDGPGAGRLRTMRRRRRRFVMLKVYSKMIEVLGMMRGVLTQIEKHDRDLGNQLRRAASSVALNIAE